MKDRNISFYETRMTITTVLHCFWEKKINLFEAIQNEINYSTKTTITIAFELTNEKK